MQRVIKRRQVAAGPLLPELSPLLSNIYRARQVHCAEQLQRNAAALLSPAGLLGIDQAATLLAQAVVQQQSVLIVGDFDADGATSSALCMLALQAFGLRQVDYLVPNRFEYGYGLTPEIVEVAKTRQPDLIVTVDNGISSIAGVAAARAAGIAVLVTDHHLPGEQLPDASAIVNPNQPGCGFASKALAGVGVAFYLLSAVRAQLVAQGWFDQQQRPVPNMAQYLDLVALGTVADVVPLDHNNRILVHQGLQRIRSGVARPGILALLEVARRNPANCSASDLGFAVGPRLNAAGRLDDMSLGIHCLLCDDPSSAQQMAAVLDEFNRDRRQIEQTMQREAEQALATLQLQDSELPFGLCLFDPNWHQGVVGIVASRIKERYHRPVIAFAKTDEGELKGSARSVPGLHIRDALDAIASRHPELLQRFGGHAMAAGLSLAPAQLAAFTTAFDAEVKRQLSADDLQQVIWTDGELPATEFTLATAEQLQAGGPWGQQFPEPLFEGQFTVINQRIVGESHLKLVLAHVDDPNLTLDAIAFRVDLEHWPNPAAELVDTVFKLDVNEFRGKRSVQLVIEHLVAV